MSKKLFALSLEVFAAQLLSDSDLDLRSEN